MTGYESASTEEVKVRLKGVVAVVALFCIGAGLLISGAQEAVEPIKIGLACELTGPRAMNGIDRMRRAQMAVEQINEAGGVLGRPPQARD